jgi:hypothetical protein
MWYIVIQIHCGMKGLPNSSFNLNFMPLNAIEIKVVSFNPYASQNNTP